MLKIVFINQVSSHLTKDIINAFAEKFDEVALISGSISETGNQLSGKVRVSRIKKYNRKSIFSRFLSWVLATFQIIFLVNIKYRGYHLFFTSNPPTTAFIPLFCRADYSVQILDIYPDALVTERFVSKNSLINRIWTRRNKKYFAKAKNIFTITSGMAKTLTQYCPAEKIRVIEQWPSSTGFSKIERMDNNFIKVNSLEDNFLVMYSGNIGLGHHVDILVKVARLLKDQKDIKFVIVGEGWNKPLVEQLIKDYGLANCLVLPYQPESMFRHSIQAADIGVVSVSKELAALCVPIKTYNLINNEIPLLCITEGDSELAVLVSKYETGKCFGPGQLNEMAQFILSLKADKDLVLRFKGNLRRCAEDFTPLNAHKYVKDFIYN